MTPEDSAARIIATLCWPGGLSPTEERQMRDALVLAFNDGESAQRDRHLKGSLDRVGALLAEVR